MFSAVRLLPRLARGAPIRCRVNPTCEIARAELHRGFATIPDLPAATDGLAEPTPIKKPRPSRAKPRELGPDGLPLPRKRSRAKPKPKDPDGTPGDQPKKRGRKTVVKDDVTPTVDLPPAKDWPKAINVIFNSKTAIGRVAISNPETADKLANAFVPEGLRDQVVIETYAGPGQLTRSLLKLPRERIKKLIVVEPVPGYYSWIKPLEAIDDRITVINTDPYSWNVYTDLEETLLKDIPITDWDAGIHPTLRFIQHVPSTVLGEQLLNQYIRTIPDRMWIFKYGRINLDFIIAKRTLERLVPTDLNQRCKLSVFGEATVKVSQPVPQSEIEDYEANFFPAASNSTRDMPHSSLSGRRVGSPHIALRLEPLEKSLIEPATLDSWDFVLRKLFISKATPISKSLPTLAHGAGTLLKSLTNPNLPPNQQLSSKICPRDMSVHDWAKIVQAFIKWPFRPQNIAIDGDFLHVGKHGQK